MLRTPEKTINAIAGRNKEFAEELTKWKNWEVIDTPTTGGISNREPVRQEPQRRYSHKLDKLFEFADDSAQLAHEFITIEPDLWYIIGLLFFAVNCIHSIDMKAFCPFKR
jgi:hypothetical protein